MAIERPTPVSSLLHSSTIVVARVYLIILSPIASNILILVVIMSISMVVQIDVKKNIAYSTSIHLILIAMVVMSGLYSVVVIYIILHGMVKGQLFQSSGYEIHGVGSQDMRKFNIGGSTFMMVGAIFLLGALVGIVMLRSKEAVVLGFISLMILIMVCVSMLYTVVYLNKLSVACKFGESEGFYVLLLIVVSMMSVDINFDFWISYLMFRLIFMLFYGNVIITVV